MDPDTSERRRPRRFRILYIGMRAFVDRIILGRTPPKSAAPATPPPSQAAARAAQGAREARPAPRPAGAFAGLSTGIPEIDRQHRELLGTIHELQRTLQAGGGEGSARQPLAFLLSYCDTHFRVEEAYMRRIGYPGLEAHVGEHAQLRARVMDLQARVARGESGVALECSILLFQWLREHITEVDGAYVDHARARGLDRGVHVLVAEPLDLD